MKKLIHTFNGIWMSIILFSAVSMQSMENPGNELKKWEHLASHIKRFNHNNVFFLLPTEILTHILFDCLVHDNNQSEALKNSIKTFMKLSMVCKNFNKLLTFETIGNVCKNYTQNDKNKVLQNLIETTTWHSYTKIRLPALIVVHAGADVNTTVDSFCLLTEVKTHSSSLLEKAVTCDDKELVAILFKHKADPNTTDFNCPIFFYASIDVLQMFLVHNVNIHATESYEKTNVLWHISENNYPTY